jgi:hypothetical protein
MEEGSMKFAAGLILMAFVLAFITYEMGWGGGKREHGRNGGWPLW